MALDHFIQIEQERDGDRSFTIYHRANPRFSMEIKPLYDADGRRRDGVIQRIRIQNSWTRDYHQYSKLISEAEALYRRTLKAAPNRI